MANTSAATYADAPLDVDELLRRIQAATAAAGGSGQIGLLGGASDGSASPINMQQLPPDLLSSGAPPPPSPSSGIDLSGLSPSLLGGVPATPQPATGYGLLGQSDQSASLLGSPDPMPLPEARPTGSNTSPSPDVAPADPATPAHTISAPSATDAMSKLPTWGHRNFLGDLADNVLFGGAIQRTRLSERDRSIADFQSQRMAEVWNGLTPDQRAAFAANPKEFGKALSDNFSTHQVAAGATLTPGTGMRGAGPGGGAFTAPILGTDNGRNFTQRPEGTTITGFTGPKVNADGQDERTGLQYPKASTAVVPFGSAVHSVVQAGNAAARFPQVGGDGLDELQGARSQATGTSGAPLPPLPVGTRPASASAPAGARSPLAKGAPVATAIRSAAMGAGLSADDSNALVAIARQESSLNPYGPHNGSSTGLFQFHPDTFKALGGTDINDPQQQIAAAVKSYQQNRQALTSTLKRAPTTTELYLAHQQGLAGAKALLTADPSASAADVLTPAYSGNARRAAQAVTGNAGSADATVGQFLNGWGQRMQRQVAAASRIHDPTSGSAPQASPAAAQPDIGASGFQGFQDISSGPPAGPHLLQAGDPRLKQFAPGAAVEDDGIGHLKVMEGTGFTPAAMNEIYTRNSKDLAEYTGVVPLVRALRSSIKDPSAAADLSMVEAAARVFNPKATVRQGVMKAFDDTNGLPDQIVGALHQINGGGANARLSPATRSAILGQAEQRAGILRQSAQPIIDAQTAFAKRNGINPADILPPVEELGPSSPKSSSAAPVRLDTGNPQAAFAALPTGALFIGPDGRTRRKP